MPHLLVEGSNTRRTLLLLLNSAWRALGKARGLRGCRPGELSAGVLYEGTECRGLRVCRSAWTKCIHGTRGKASHSTEQATGGHRETVGDSARSDVVPSGNSQREMPPLDATCSCPTVCRACSDLAHPAHESVRWSNGTNVR